MKHIARKRFGQHFLTDGGIIDAIVQAIDPRAGQPMVEIGPGLAALTQPLVERLGHLTVIELDRDLAQRLPSSNSRDYGRGFADIFKEAGYDFYKLDGALFAPAEVWVSHLDSGLTFHAGRTDLGLLLPDWLQEA